MVRVPVNREVVLFLDRDGVINRPIIKNRKPFAPRSLEEFYIYRYAYPALVKLQKLSVRLVVVTNQPDIGNGYMKLNVLNTMHLLMLKNLPIDLVQSCIHSQKDGCACRKPGVALLAQAIEILKIKPSIKFMVGDRKSDMDAGKKFGCKTIFIDRNYAENVDVIADCTVKNLLEATRVIEKNLNTE